MSISTSGFLHLNPQLTRQGVADLARLQDGWCLSLYMPLPADGRGPALLKRLDVEARRQLALHALSPREIETILSPVERILEAAPGFARLQGKGLAVLSSHAGSAAFLLAEAPEPSAEVDLRFHLDPLIPSLMAEDEFLLLSLGLHEVRLYEGGRTGLREIPLNGGRIPAPQGQPMDRHSAQDFCHDIDDALKARLRGREAPLLLAGIYPLLSLYRKANTYPHLLPEAIVADPDAEDVHGSLHRLAWDRLKTARAREREFLLRDLREDLGAGRTASGLAETLPSAYVGAVRHLLVREGYSAWGSFEPDRGQVIEVPVPLASSENLVHLACLRTLLGGGRVHPVRAEDMPAGADIAAVCRF